MKLRHFNHERLIIIAIWVGLIGTLSTLGWELPVQSVIDPTCDKSAQWGDLDDSCKLKIYDNGSVPTETASVGDLLFSVLRGASYSDNRTPKAGGHPSLDIVSVQGTPIYSIGEGTVTNASLRNGYGNAITIKHTLNDGTVVFSNYSHLDKMVVSQGDTVSEGEYIGDMGRTGFTMGRRGNHLDFQITTSDSPSHPYGYHDCEVSYYDAVEQGSCGDKLKKYTIDPITFFLEHGDYDLSPLTGIPLEREHSVAPVTTKEVNTLEQKQVKEELIVDDKELSTQNPTNATTPLPDNNINTLLKAIVSNRKKLHNNILSGLQKEFDQFAKQNIVNQQVAGEVSLTEELPTQNDLPYTISRTLPEKTGTEQVGKVLAFHFTITDKLGAEFTGSMDEKVTIEYNKEHIAIAPGRFSRIVDGSKNLFITPKKAVNTTIVIKYGDTILGTETLLYGNN